MGPGESFPVSPAGEHLKAAWDLAGHAANPDAVRANILRFAHEHGLMDHLPQAARDHMKQHGMAAKKAKGSDVAAILHTAYQNAHMDDSSGYSKRSLVRAAHEHGLTQHLPPEAHGLLHDMGLSHEHDGVDNDEMGLHTHVVTKAYNPIAKQGLIVKSWIGDDANAYTEGWLATTRRDMEKDVTEPEAFVAPAESYFARRAPLSIEHNGKSTPVGHLQSADIMRDGKIVKSVRHPVDGCDPEHRPTEGTGVWVRAVVNEEPGISAVRKGNVGGYSFIANAVEYEPLPGGRYRYLKFDPWIESTIAAYPVNPDAVIAVAKAFGLQPEQEKETTMTLDEILAQAAEAKRQQDVADAAALAQKGISATDLGQMLAEFNAKIEATIDSKIETVTKSFAAQPGAGTGSKATVPTESPFEADPVSYLVAKAQKGDDNFDDAEKAVVGELTLQALLTGMAD